MFGNFFFKSYKRLSKLAKGGLNISLIEVVRYLVEFCIILVTARLLEPSDFGLIALAITIISVIDAFTDLGIKTAIIQNKNNKKNFLSSGWFLIIIRSLLLYFIIFFFAEHISIFYSNYEIELIIKILALRTILQSLVNPYQLLNIKELNYKNYTWTMISGILVKIFCVIPLAFILKNYWVLVFGSLISPFVKVIISYYLDRRILIPKFSYIESVEILKFSSWLLLSRISQIILQNIPRLIIGKLISIDFLGGFKIAEQIGFFSNNIMKKFTTYLTLPFFSKKFNNNDTIIKKSIVNYIVFIFSVILPFSLIVTLSSKELILFLFGAKWLFIEPMLIYMIIYGSLLTFSNSIFVLVVAYGKPSNETFVRLISLGAFCICIIFNNSMYGILNSILLSGIILLLGAFINLYLLKILDILIILKNFVIYNLPVLGILISFVIITKIEISQITSLFIFLIFSIISYVSIAFILYLFYKTGPFSYLKFLK